MILTFSQRNRIQGHRTTLHTSIFMVESMADLGKGRDIQAQKWIFK